VNGSACSQNSYLINKLLKDELGFQGFIMTDWLAQISGVASALAGLDMNMPGDGTIPLFGDSFWMYELTRSVLNGSVPLSRLDDMATRIVATWYQMGQDQNYPEPNFSSYSSDAEGPLYPGALISPTGVINEFVNVQADHYLVARNISQDAITLVKNVNNTLPLNVSATFKIFGDDAQANTDGINSCSDRGCDKGTLGMGWGSGTSNYPYMDAPIDAIRNRTSKVTYFPSNSFPSNSNPQPADVAIVFINSDSGENYITVEGNNGDRNSAGLYAWHNGDDLVKNAAARYSTVVVVVHTVGPILVENWIDLPSVKAVVIAHLPGQEAGVSLTNVLFGDVSPSGHLPYSIPKAESDYPASLNLVSTLVGQPQDTYSEGLYIDYRYLNKHNIAPRFPFGYGLSYTTFNYSAKIISVTKLTSTPPPPGAKGNTPVYSSTIPPASEAYYPDGFKTVWRYLYSYLSKSDANAAASRTTPTYPYPTGYSTTQQTVFLPAGGGQGGNPALWDVAYNVTVTVTNTGKVPGKAVAQAYVQYPSDFGYDTPIIQLRDFGKTSTLAPGASETVTLSFTRKDLSAWDVKLQNWVAGSGEYTIWIGESSGELTLGCSTSTLTCSNGLTSPV
jgi:beta-glucosidase